MKTLFVVQKVERFVAALILICLLMASGCTVRGGWPRFLRSGESWGWSGAKPDPKPTQTNSVNKL